MLPFEIHSILTKLDLANSFNNSTQRIKWTMKIRKIGFIQCGHIGSNIKDIHPASLSWNLAWDKSLNGGPGTAYLSTSDQVVVTYTIDLSFSGF